MFPETKSHFVRSDFREAGFRGPYDLLLTSPPFADSEHYGSELPGPSDWKDATAAPLAEMASMVLSRDGKAAIHCGDRRGLPMSDMITNSMVLRGFVLNEVLSYGSKQSVLVFGR
jgi:hypothetical protein